MSAAPSNNAEDLKAAVAALTEQVAAATIDADGDKPKPKPKKATEAGEGDGADRASTPTSEQDSASEADGEGEGDGEGEDEAEQSGGEESKPIAREDGSERAQRGGGGLGGDGVDAENAQFRAQMRGLSRPQITAQINRISEELTTAMKTADDGGDGVSDAKAAIERHVVQIRKFLSIEHNPPIDAVIQACLLPLLIRLLESDNHKLAFEAAWALTNVVSGTSAHAAAVVEAGAIPKFIRLLRSADRECSDQAIWALGNLAGDGPQLRDQLLRMGVLESIIPMLQPDKLRNARLSLIRTLVWTVSNFCRGKPAVDFRSIRDVIPCLVHIATEMNDEETLTDVAWAFAYITEDNSNDNHRIQAVLDTGVMRRLVELLGHQSANIKTAALRACANVVTGDDQQTEAMLQSGLVPALAGLLNNPRKGIRKEAIWCFSNITAGSESQIQRVIDAGAIPIIITILGTDIPELQKEAAWVISNLTSGGSNEQTSWLSSQVNCLAAMTSALRDVRDLKISLVILEGIRNMLRVGLELSKSQGDGAVNRVCALLEDCGGLDIIESCQNSPSQEVYEMAVNILSTYFEEADDDEANGGDAEKFKDGGSVDKSGGGGGSNDSSRRANRRE